MCSSRPVKLPDGAYFAVDGVLASDKTRDVAIIKAHGNGFKTLTLGDSDRLQVGEEVVAIGNPLSLESTVSNGIVSAIRTIEDEGGKFVQITAPISPGSSGGPLFNMAGRVVGITTSHLRNGENLNFAVPINDVKPMLLSRSSKANALPDEPETAIAEQTTGPSLADTLQWMKAISAHPLRVHQEIRDSSMSIFPNGFSCQNFGIVVVLSTQFAPQANRTTSITNHFDLGDVDPNSITEVDHSTIQFRTTNNQNKIGKICSLL